MNPTRIPIRTEAEARAQLSPHMDDVIACIRHGFAEWERIGQTERGFRAPLGPRARAIIIYEHIAQEAWRRFGSKEGVVLTNKRGFLTAHIGSDFILRFKKLDAQGLARNVQTKQQMLFSRQLAMFGLGAETRITAGYQLDKLGTAIVDIKVVCPDGRRNAWGFSAIEDRDDDLPRVAPRPTMPVQPAGDTVVVPNPERIRRDERATGENA